MAIAFILSFGSFAQNDQGKITGIVIDEEGKPVTSATLSLMRTSDSAIIKMAVSGSDGRFLFDKIAGGSYLVVASSVSYYKKTSALFFLNTDDHVIELPVLKLAKISKELGAVTVNSKRSFIEARADKIILNVEASPVNAGASVQELLEKAPGVSVDGDGNISLRGKAGVTIMIDGKPTFLSPNDLINVLKNMPSSSVDQIEIMTTPPAKFDASGNSGIINIKTKKGRTDGLNVSLSLVGTLSTFEQDNTFYVMPKTQNSIIFNYKKSKFNFFGNYNPNAGKSRAFVTIKRKKLDQYHNTTGYNLTDTKYPSQNENHTLKLGVDFSPAKKTTVGAVVSMYTYTAYPEPKTITSFFDATYQPISGLRSYAMNTLHNKNILANINLRQLFDTTGKELSVDFDYTAYDNSSDVVLATSVLDVNGQNTGNESLLKGHLPADIKIYSFKTDYIHPLKNKGRIEIGGKGSFVRNNSKVDYASWDGGKWVADARSNHFIYEESIKALYINGSKELKKWTLQGGLRLESTTAKGDQVTIDSSFKRVFTKIFPTLFISRKIKKESQLILSYGKRITRPNYRDLNPFSYFLDSLTTQSGNPFLLPQISNNLEFSYSLNRRLIVTLNYSRTGDAIAQIVKTNGDLLLLTSENMASLRNMGIAINSSFSIKNKWTMNLFTNVFNNHYNGFYNSTPLDLSYTSFSVNMTQTFTMKKGFLVELSGVYNSKGVSDISIIDPVYYLNIGAQKTVIKGKGTIRASIRDLFWSQRTVRVRQYDVVDTKLIQKSDTRALTLSFTYRFGKANQKVPNRNGAGTEERSRVG